MRSKAFLPKIMMCKLNRIGSLAPGSAKLLSRVDLFLSERGGGVSLPVHRGQSKMSDGLPCSLETGSLPESRAVLVTSKPQRSHTTGIFMLVLGTRTHAYVTLSPSPQLRRFTL